MEFLLCILQYLIIMVILAGVGVLGGVLGTRLRRSKDAKSADSAGEHSMQ